MATNGSGAAGGSLASRVLRELSVVIAAVLGLVCFVPPVASAKARDLVRPVAIHVAFHNTGQTLDGVQSNGRYVFEARLGAPGGVLVDSLTGQRRTISGGKCQGGFFGASVFGGPWLMFSCPFYTSYPFVKLYSLATGAQMSVALPPE